MWSRYWRALLSLRRSCPPTSSPRIGGSITSSQPPKVDPIVQTDFGVEIVKVFFPYTGAEASSEAEAPPPWNLRGFRPRVHVGRRPVLERLVGPLLVVEPEVPAQLRPRVGHRVVVLQVHFLVLDRAPQPFAQHVVEGPPAPIHTHPRPGGLHPIGEQRRRELGPLVGVEDLRRTPVQRRLERVEAALAIDRNRQLPRQHVTAE